MKDDDHDHLRPVPARALGVVKPDRRLELSGLPQELGLDAVEIRDLREGDTQILGQRLALAPGGLDLAEPSLRGAPRPWQRAPGRAQLELEGEALRDPGAMLGVEAHHRFVGLRTRSRILPLRSRAGRRQAAIGGRDGALERLPCADEIAPKRLVPVHRGGRQQVKSGPCLGDRGHAPLAQSTLVQEAPDLLGVVESQERNAVDVGEDRRVKRGADERAGAADRRERFVGSARPEERPGHGAGERSQYGEIRVVRREAQERDIARALVNESLDLCESLDRRGAGVEVDQQPAGRFSGGGRGYLREEQRQAGRYPDRLGRPDERLAIGGRAH